ncbi:MAG: TPM domain-containing protein [Tenuifilum sp.]|uniref:TPM domain-containing protein n=1 Tax=Tenuifilum sp. TaxID=2760880 RepID=UPI0030A5A955
MKRILYTILSLLALTVPVKAQDIPDPMSPPRLVNDFAGILSADEQYALEQKLRAYNDTTSTQIYVVTVKDLNGYEPSDFAFRLGEKWSVGQKGKNNGIIILIKPKIGNDKGRAFIATGYGMEEVIPDVTARQIVDKEMIPYFKENRYYKGIDAAINVIIDLAAGLYTADEYYSGESPWPGIIFIIIFFAIIFLSARRGNRLQGGSIGRNLPFWLLMSSMGSGRGSSFGHFSSGSGSFGGFSGGGGGSFGGGGAGGSW